MINVERGEDMFYSKSLHFISARQKINNIKKNKEEDLMINIQYTDKQPCDLLATQKVREQYKKVHNSK